MRTLSKKSFRFEKYIRNFKELAHISLFLHSQNEDNVDNDDSDGDIDEECDDDNNNDGLKKQQQQIIFFFVLCEVTVIHIYFSVISLDMSFE